VDAHGMPVRIMITDSTTADCTQDHARIEGLNAENLLADRGYDSDAILHQAQSRNMEAVIPLKKNRKKQRHYDKKIYALRPLVENAFLPLKRWRGDWDKVCNKLGFLFSCCSNQILGFMS
jgi:transposase